MHTLVTRLQDFDHAGVAVHSVAGRLDTATPVGRLLLAVLAVLAQDEADGHTLVDRLTATRTRNGTQGRARRRHRSRSGSGSATSRVRRADPPDNSG